MEVRDENINKSFIQLFSEFIFDYNSIEFKKFKISYTNKQLFEDLKIYSWFKESMYDEYIAIDFFVKYLCRYDGNNFTTINKTI